MWVGVSGVADRLKAFTLGWVAGTPAVEPYLGHLCC
jgi:hypothetical protein